MKYGKIKTRDFIVTGNMDSIYPCSNGFVYVSFKEEMTQGFIEVTEEVFLNTLQDFFFEPGGFKTKVPIGLADSKNYGFVRLTNDIDDGSKYKVPTAYLLNEVYKMAKKAYELATTLENPENDDEEEEEEEVYEPSDFNKYPVFDILSQMIGNKTLVSLKDNIVTETIIDSKENNVALRTTSFSDKGNEIIETTKIAGTNLYDTSSEIKVETKKQADNIITNTFNSLDLNSMFEKTDASAFIYTKLKNSHGVKIINKPTQNGREETVTNIKTNKIVASKTTIYNIDNITQDVLVFNEGSGKAIAEFKIITTKKVDGTYTMSTTGSISDELDTKNISSAYIYSGLKYLGKSKVETKTIDGEIKEEVIDMETNKTLAKKDTSFDNSNFKVTEKITLLSNTRDINEDTFVITTTKTESNTIEIVIN